ncbi:glycosyltransferase family 1 protein [Anaerolineae bacterium CFX7]|nr:glycosyltransferase family 1 protein [Anaerolineae bacterium CFX7]
MNIVFISPIAWDNSGGAHRPVQFAQELARRGHTVTYIEIEKSRAPLPDANPRVLNFETLGWDSVNFLRAWYGLAYAAPAHSGENFFQIVPPARAARGIVICAAPFRPALELLPAFAARGYALVYDALDDISEMRALGSYCYDDLAEQYLAQNAGLIVTLSPRLAEKFSAQKNVTLLRDGVDLAPFRRAPSDTAQTSPYPLARGEITVGFWGTMWDYNLDLPLLQTITRARPAWQFHFIGAYDLDPTRVSLTKLLDAPNVHFHPSVARAVLAQAAQNFDVCILPTPVTPFNLARDPLKVYEYLACYKPVVSTNLPQLADMPYVQLARDANEFLADIERAARAPIDRAALDAYLQEQTWTKRTAALLDALNKLPFAARAMPAPPRGAMPNADNELDRAHAYAKHLERVVQARDAHIHALENALQQSSLAQKIRRALRLA